jgi:hypothetical protein
MATPGESETLPRGARDDRSLAVLIGAGLAVYVALFLATAVQAFVGAPFGDVFDILTVEFAAQARHDPGLYLWSPHNGHHVVWMRLLTAIDVRIFHGRSLIFLGMALAAIAGAAALLAREIRRGVGDRRLSLVLAATAPLALLTSLNAVDVSLPVNSNYPLALLFALGACVLVEAGGTGIATVAGVTVLVAAATMSITVGLAAAPVVMLSALLRRGRGRLWLLWLTLPALGALFLSGGAAPVVDGAAPVGSPGDHLARMARYFLTFCALPWSASSQKVALPHGLGPAIQLAGLALGAAVAAVATWLAAQRAKSRLERVCRNLILLSLTAAAMAALGRVDVSAGIQVPLRYALLMAPLHVAVLVRLGMRWAALRRLGPGALRAAASVVLALAIVHQFAGRVVVVGYAHRLREAIAAFDAGDRSPALRDFVYPQFDHAERITAEMRRRGLYGKAAP